MRENEGRREWLVAALVVLVLGALLGLRLFPDPVVGIADNGDFVRLMCPCKISHPEDRTRTDRYFNWINGTFVIGEQKRCPDVFSSATVPIRVAKALNGVLGSSPGKFDIRFLGFVNVVLFIAGFLAVAYSTKGRRLAIRIAMIVLACLILADVGYAVFLNSFFGEAAILVFMSLTAGTFLLVTAAMRGPEGRSVSRASLLLLFAAMNLLLVVSKPQTIVLAAASLLLGFHLFQRCRNRVEQWIVVATIMVLPFFSFLMAGSLEPSFVRANRYAAIFGDLLHHSPTPREDLRELGLPEDYDRYIGFKPFSPQSPIYDREFARKFDEVGYDDLAIFYLRHPSRAFADLRRSAGHVFDTRFQGVFGHYQRGPGRPAKSQSTFFSLWSAARERFLPRKAWFLVLFGAVNLAALWIKNRRFDEDDRDRGVSALHLWILAVGAIQFVIVSLTDGTADPKHMLLFNLAFDACCALLLLYLFGAVYRKRPVHELAGSEASGGEPGPGGIPGVVEDPPRPDTP